MNAAVPPVPMLTDCARCDAPDPAVNFHAASQRWMIACAACERGVEAPTLEEATHRWNRAHSRGPGVLGWIFIALCIAFVATLVLE